MEQVKTENLFKYSKSEDTLNYLTHGFGAVLSLCSLVYLLAMHRDLSVSVTIGIIIYGLSMFALFAASSLYHFQQDPAKRAFLKRMDHAMILVMISGTYAPFCLVMATPLSYLILVIVYLLSIVGILLKVKYINVNKIISIIIYLIVGWLAVFMFKDIVAFFDPIVVILMVVGGVIYSLGALVYAIAKFEYHHALWHVFVLVAAIVFFLAVNAALYV